MALRTAYVMNDKMYMLVLDYTVSKSGRVWLAGVDIEDMAGHYLGYWLRSNMPLTLISECNRVIKNNRAREVNEAMANYRKASRK